MTGVFADGEPKVQAAPSLADAASDGLEEFMVPAADEQKALIPVVKVKFSGLKYDLMDDLPELKKSLRFEIEGFVVGHGQTVLANGEIQDMATVKVTRIVPLTE